MLNLIKIFSICTLSFSRNIHKGLFFSIFVTNKTFKFFFPKRDFIRYNYFTNIQIFIEIIFLC